MRYWDSSALVSLVVSEAETGNRRDLLRQDPRVVTWWASRVECASAVHRLARGGDISSAELTHALEKLRLFSAGWIQVRPTARVRQRALRLLRIHGLRAADALQLAAALTACDDDPSTLALVCSDARLSDAANLEGFVVQ